MPKRVTKSYPGSIRRHGDRWQIRLHIGGKKYHTFTVNGTREDAETAATDKHAELKADRERKLAGLPGPITFSALIEEFTAAEIPDLSPGTRKSYGDSFKPFREYFVERNGDPLVSKIRRADVKRYISWRRTYRVGGAGGVSKHTVARDLRVLKRLMNYAIDMEYVDANPCTRVKAPKPDDRTPPILDDAQYARLLTAAESHPMLHTYIILLAETGCRAYSEALKLEWADVDLQGGFLHIKSAAGRRTKSGKSRWVPMTTRLRGALQEHAAQFRLSIYNGRRPAFVFHHTRTTRRAVAGDRIRTFRNAFERAAAAAELPAGFRPHDLRHRRVTTWLAAGKNAVHVKEAVGHADLATTMGYTHLLPEHLRALVEEPPGPGMATDMAIS